MTTPSTGKVAGYETTIITRNELSDDAVKLIQDKLKSVAQSFGGDTVLMEDWGNRKLAYPIHKEVRGRYTYCVYSGKGDVVAEVERHLRIHDHVLRFLTVNLESEFDPEQFTKRRGEIQAAIKKREEERERAREERAERHHFRDRERDGGGGRGDRDGGRPSRDEFMADDDGDTGSEE